jgi:hypothetical protein
MAYWSVEKRISTIGPIRQSPNSPQLVGNETPTPHCFFLCRTDYIPMPPLGRVGVQKFCGQHTPSDFRKPAEHIANQLTAGSCQVLMLGTDKRQ